MKVPDALRRIRIMYTSAALAPPIRKNGPVPHRYGRKNPHLCGTGPFTSTATAATASSSRPHPIGDQASASASTGGVRTARRAGNTLASSAATAATAITMPLAPHSKGKATVP